MSARCLTENAVEGHPQPRGYKGTVEQKLAGGADFLVPHWQSWQGGVPVFGERKTWGGFWCPVAVFDVAMSSSPLRFSHVIHEIQF